MGDITILWVVMLLVALASFAPLGIFIYRFSHKAEDPLGSAHPGHQPNPKIEAWVDGLLGRFLSKRQSVEAHPAQASVEASEAETQATPPTPSKRGRGLRKKAG